MLCIIFQPSCQSFFYFLTQEINNLNLNGKSDCASASETVYHAFPPKAACPSPARDLPKAERRDLFLRTILSNLIVKDKDRKTRSRLSARGGLTPNSRAGRAALSPPPAAFYQMTHTNSAITLKFSASMFSRFISSNVLLSGERVIFLCIHVSHPGFAKSYAAARSGYAEARRLRRGKVGLRRTNQPRLHFRL